MPYQPGYKPPKVAAFPLGFAGLLLAGLGLYYLVPIVGVAIASNSSGAVRSTGSWLANLRIGSVLDYAQARGAVRRLAK